MDPRGELELSHFGTGIRNEGLPGCMCRGLCETVRRCGVCKSDKVQASCAVYV